MKIDPNTQPSNAEAKTALEDAVTALVVNRVNFLDAPKLKQNEELYWPVVAMAIAAANGVIDKAFENGVLSEKQPEQAS